MNFVENESIFVQLIFIFIQIHLNFMLFLCGYLIGHITDEFVYISIFYFFFIGVHNILNVFVQDIHAFLLSYKSFHGLFIALIFHFIAGISHDFGHTSHHILHGFVDCHLLQSISDIFLLESEILELSIKVIVFLDHLVVLEDLLSDHFFGLCRLLLIDFFLQLSVQIFALVF